MNSVGRRTSWLLAAVLVPFFGGIVFEYLDGRSFFADSEALAGIAFIAYGIVGVLVLRREPGHALGRVLWAVGVLTSVTTLADEYARLASRPGEDLPGFLPAAWLQNWTWFLPMGLIFTFGLLLFPDGRLPGPRWRWVARLAAASLGLLTIGFLLHGEPLDGFEKVPNPTGVLPDDFPGTAAAFAGVILSAFAAVASVIVRMRRSQGIERLQVKWIAYAAAVMLAAVTVLPLFGGAVDERVSDLVFGIIFLLLPAAFGVAMTKHRLYDIDVVINRTLVYASLTLVLAAVYGAVVFGLQALLAPFTEGSDLAVAASTLAVAGLFRPLRARVQSFIDRRFYRSRYDARRTLDEIAHRIRNEVELEQVSGDVLEMVRSTVVPRHVTLWMRSEAPRTR